MKKRRSAAKRSVMLAMGWLPLCVADAHPANGSGAPVHDRQPDRRSSGESGAPGLVKLQQSLLH